MCAETVDLHDAHNRDGGDSLVLSYRQQNYTKTLEFADFALRLRRSHQCAVARAELATLKPLTQVCIT